MRKIILIQLFVLFCLFLSCSKEYTFQNPNDPNVIIDTWKPTELIITPISATSLKLSWIDNCTNEQGFKISRKVGNGVWEENIATVGENITQWTDTNASIGNTYSYKVRVFASNITSSGIEKSYVFQLSTPTSLSNSPLSPTSLRLNWQDSNQFEQGFKISRKVGSGAWEEDIATVTENITQWTDNSINSYLNDFTYKVRAYYNNVYSDFSNEITNSSTFISVSGGTFQMGSSNGNANEQPIHSVILSSFIIGTNEVTQSEWQGVMGEYPAIGAGEGSYYPIYNVNWYTVLVYCNKRSLLEGLTPCYAKDGDTNPNNWGSIPTSNNSSWNAITCNWSANGYRLPTEAEWEYAARGGNQSQGYTYSGSNTIGNVAWYSINSGSTTHQVGTKAPNELGIFDMSGNVWEWCWDWYGSYSSNAETNPTGPASGSNRVLRGGSWCSDDYFCRVAFRDYSYPGGSNSYIGFRLVRSIP